MLGCGASLAPNSQQRKVVKHSRTRIKGIKISSSIKDQHHDVRIFFRRVSEPSLFLLHIMGQKKGANAMEQWLLWGLTLYGAIWFLLFQGIRTFSFRFPKDCTHLVLFTKNSQSSIEWVVRSFYLWNWCLGREGWITCIDEGSMDDTKVILYRLQPKYPRLKLLSKYDPLVEEITREAKKDDKTIIIDLKKERISFPQLLSEKREPSVKGQL